ncbi:TonB family C-terminal domain-containing protein [Dyadobacter soli]|uniref:TonB family C-terminal domain-containing protein n=1 Tax=Dyadobacter soli TaxID=659014 RepID=A0A1G7EQE1_9BACT|nr:energy transducer TonB [Dyadobacter soli]SDE65849.1 TonB family C-terminal domain-containing protein [Dyadobacter soli]
MKKLLTLLLFSGVQAFAQQVYLPHEVEKQAEPAGGLTVLNQFISSNLQIPFESSVKGVNGRVYLKGVVQPDGSMTNIEVTRGIDTLCNSAAVRVLGMYRAWKPAMLGGQKVRQNVFFPVTFKAEARPGYDASRLAFVDYFNEVFVPVDSAQATYRRTTPVDSLGFISGDVAYEESKRKKWKKLGEAKFARTQIRYKSNYVNPGRDSIAAYRISARDYNEGSHASEAIFNQEGQILSYTEYGVDGKAALIKDYDLNGMVRRQQLLSDSLVTDVYWDVNGQIRAHRDFPVNKMGVKEEPLLMNAWGPDGVQYAKNGEGYWMAVGETPDGKWLFEQGKITQGIKDAKWVGKLADSTQYYEEVYDLGQFKSGVSWVSGTKMTYEKPQVQPEFKGGMKEFYKFLASNIRYPPNAAKSGVTGRVMLSFVVCEDGSMCDYKVENRIGHGIDEEALRVVKLMNGKWEPGVLRGQKVRVKYNLPVNFQMETTRIVQYR